jgi:hypothetical protein
MRDTALQNDRYLAFGGIEGLSEAYIKGDITFKHAAIECGVVPQTIRSDFVRYFGVDSYQALIRQRRRVVLMRTQTISKIDLTLEEARHALSLEQHLDLQVRGNSLAFLSVACSAIDISGVRLSARGVAEIKAPVGWVTVRVFKADPELKENGMGLHRLRPSAKPSSSGFRIYAIINSDKIVSYIFEDGDVMRMKSLCLRFLMLDRIHKYRFALNNWKSLNK